MDYKYVLSKQTGNRHIEKGLVCQDSVKGHAENGVCCIALSDGAGSVANSEVVADISTSFITSVLCDEFSSLYEMDSKGISQSLIERLRRDILCKTEVEAACTLLFFAAASDGRVIYGHLGDGIIIGIDCDYARAISLPENGEEPNQTYFVSHPEAEYRFRISKERYTDYNTVLLCSDGLSGSLYNFEKDNVANAVLIMSDWIKRHTGEETEMLIKRELEDMFSRYSDDDMSIAMLRFQEEY